METHGVIFSTTCGDCVGHDVSACALGCNLHYNYFKTTFAHLKHLNNLIGDKMHGQIRQTGLLQITVVWCRAPNSHLGLIRSPTLLLILDSIVDRLVLGLLQLSGFMMTSSNGNIFRVTCLSWRESTGNRWIPLTKASDAELWCLFFDMRLNKRLKKQSRRRWFETPSRSLWCHYNVIGYLGHQSQWSYISVAEWVVSNSSTCKV